MNKLLVFALIFSLSISVYAQNGTILINVRDAFTNSLLEGANVLLIDKGIGGLTDQQGSLNLTGIDEGSYTLSVSFVGYKVRKQIVKVEANKTVTINVTLTPTVLQGQTVEITATRARERETPATFTNLSQKELSEMYYGQDIPMILSSMPSTTWYSENGNGIGYSYVKMRGFDQARIGVTLNGVPLNDAQSHLVYWIDMPDMGSSVQDIQVQRGGGLSSYGASSIGGTINMSTSDFASKKGMEATVGTGSYNTQKLSLAVSSGLIDNTYAVYGRFSKVRTDGYRRNTWADLWSYHLSFVRYDESITTRVNIFGGPEKTHLSYEGITKQELTTDRRANKFTYANEIDNFNQPQYQLSNEWQLNPKLLLTNTLYYIKGDGYYEQFKSEKKLTDYGLTPFRTTDTLLYPASYYGYDSNGNLIVRKTDLVRQKALDLQDFGWITTAEWKHSQGVMQFGGEIRLNTGRHFGTLVWASALPAGTQPNTRYYDYMGYRNTYGLFVREQYALTEELRLFGSIQYQATSYGILDDKFSYHHYSMDYSFLMPRFGINYNISPSLNIYANYSMVKREPTLNDIHNEGNPLFQTMIPGVTYNNPLLKPETLNDIECGVGYVTETFNAKLNGYWMDFQDELIYGGRINGVGEPIIGNAEHSLHRGIELTASANPISYITVSGNITLSENYFVTYTEYTYDEFWNVVSYNRNGNTIANFPGIIANLRTQFEMSGFNITAAIQHVGKQYLDNSENEQQNPAARAAAGYTDKIVNAYTVVNLSLQYRLPAQLGLHGTTLSIHINNLFDSVYEYAGHLGYDDGVPRWFPAAERNFFASIQVNL